MSEWKEYKLGDICARLSSGKGISMHDTATFGDFPIFGGNGIRGYSHKNNFDGECAIIGRQGAYCGNVRYFNGCAYMTEHAIVMIANSQHNTRFLSYFLALQNLGNLSAQSAQPGLSVKIISEQKYLLPSVEEQERIAGILSSLDDKIDLLTRQNRTLEAMAETLFRQYFIETTEIQSGKLGDYIIETTGGDWGKENHDDEFSKAVQCIRGTDIADLNSGIATKTPIRFVKEVKFEKIEPRNGDLILEISGGTETQSTGRVTYINDDIKSLFDYPLVFSNFCRMLRMKDVRYSYFTYCYINYLYQQDEFFNLENGSSGIKNLDYKALLFDLEYPMPKSEQVIDDFNVLVKPLFEKINKNKQQIRNLTKLRDTLLPKLMNNEIKI